MVRLALALCVFSLTGISHFAVEAAPAMRVPVILDTDIGDDIDDTWALGLLLKSPELDLKLVVGDNGKNLYRAKLLARFLERARRTDVPVGLGIDTATHGAGGQAGWVGDYNLNAYPGKVYADGVQAMIELIMHSSERVTLIGIGPAPNLAAALAREPAIASRARFVGMYGSVRKGYSNSDQPAAEYNVKQDAKACQRVLSAGWDITITPLDTCGLVHLHGADYARVREAKNPIAQAIIENYRIWLGRDRQRDADTHSSTLFDTVAVYLAMSDTLCTIEELGIRVTDDGFTVIDPNAKRMRVAIAWKDLPGYERWLAERLAE
jgi:inosine-uridine nucleoside N-ribohydrolase